MESFEWPLRAKTSRNGHLWSGCATQPRDPGHAGAPGRRAEMAAPSPTVVLDNGGEFLEQRSYDTNCNPPPWGGWMRCAPIEKASALYGRSGANHPAKMFQKREHVYCFVMTRPARLSPTPAPITVSIRRAA
jgi:hypothetical protein